jgi:hypothetical protein
VVVVLLLLRPCLLESHRNILWVVKACMKATGRAFGGTG